MEVWSSRRCALTWKLKGTTYGRAYFLLQVSAHPTDGTGFGLLLTPTAVQTCEHPDEMQARAQAKGYRNGTKYGSLTSQVTYGMLPTPTTRDHKGSRKTETLYAAKRNETNSLPDAFSQLGKTSQLSPRFVAEMMGFPVNWTELPFQSGATNQSKPTETL
jgi:hypothetical protein